MRRKAFVIQVLDTSSIIQVLFDMFLFFSVICLRHQRIRQYVFGIWIREHVLGNSNPTRIL